MKNYQKRIGVNYNTTAEVSKADNKFMNIYICVLFFATLLCFFLLFIGIIPFYSIFIVLFGGIAIPFTYLTIEYFILKKGPVQTTSYTYKINGDKTTISNFKVDGENVEVIDNDNNNQ